MRADLTGIIALLALLLVPGWATGQAAKGGAATTTSPVTVETGSGSTQVNLTEHKFIDAETVNAPADRVWQAMVQAYDELKVPMTVMDPKARTLGSSGKRVRRIASRRISDYFECGGAYENRADRGDVYLDVRSFLEPVDSGHTTVRTVVGANVRPADSSSIVACRSNGKLQQYIFRALHKQLDPATPAAK